MTTQAHIAKLSAVEALHAGRLSPTGRARMQRHLSRCTLCEQTLRGLQIETVLVRDLPHAMPPLDFSRMELALRQQARDLTKRTRGARKTFGALALAAAVALAFVGVSRRKTAHAPAPVAQVTTQAPARVATVPDGGEVVHGEVTALRGHGSVRSETGRTRELSLLSVLEEGDTLELQPGAEVHVRVADATAFIADDTARVELASLREHAVVLMLQAGAVTSQVRHLAETERYEVHARGYAVAVRGTHFRVGLEGARLMAAVSEGRVLVTDAQGRQVSDLIAPARFSVGAATGPHSESVPELSLPSPRILTQPLAAWPALALPAWPEVQAWTVDGSTFPATAELQVRVPHGALTLQARLADGSERRLLLQVPEGGSIVEQGVLARMLRNARSAAAGRLPAEVIRRVITQGTPALQRCYELALKQQPDVAGGFILRIDVATTGRVRRVVPRTTDGPGTRIPNGLTDCIRSAAQGWHFPSPRGELTFDAPIRLMHARRGPTKPAR